MTPQEPVCTNCVHFLPNEFNANCGFICKAFDCIPNEIIEGRNDHSKPLPGQKNDLVFTKGEPQTT